MRESGRFRMLTWAWLGAVCVAGVVVGGGAMAGGAGKAIEPGDGAKPGPDAARPVRFARDIRPLLSDRCFKCHGPDAAARKAGLRLDERDSALAELNSAYAIVPGKPEMSEAWARITSDDPDYHMPPAGSGKKSLSVAEKELIRRWIEQGAIYEPHWAFVPPVRAATPVVKDLGWGKNEIDRFILARLEEERIRPSPEADRVTLARRVFMDLTGLPPTPEESDAFVADAGADAYERLVDRLLTVEPYRSRTAERLATPWLDAARYADTCGLHTDNGRQIWPWRDWVLAAYRDNMPYDRFITEQLAGDLIPNATMMQKVASGFNRNHVTTDEGGAFPEEYLVEYAVDRASTTAACFMGLTFGCARCHDHKFDPVSQEDFYKFYAYFNSIEEPGLYSQTADANRAHEPFMMVPTAAETAKLARLAKEMEDLRALQALVTPEERSAYASFVAGFSGEAGVGWHKTRVIEAKSEKTAKLAVQADGSVLAGGLNPAHDVHEFTLRFGGEEAPGGSPAPPGARLVLLEVMGDPSFFQGRVGRVPNGNAVVTGIDVEEVDREPGVDGKAPAARPVEVHWLWADHSQGGGDYRFTNALLGTKNADRGWAVDGHQTKAPHGRLMVLLLGEEVGAGKDVRVRLRYESMYHVHILGRIRLTLGSIRDTSRLPLEMSDWWMVGPFPSGEKSAYDDVIGPETATKVDFEQNFGAGNQFWKYDANLRDGVVVPLTTGQNVTFLARQVFSPGGVGNGERKLELSLGSDDGFVIYVNGKEQARRKVDRSVAPDQDKVTITLRPGMNLLVLKIVNTGGDGAYYFRPLIGEETYPHDLVPGMFPEALLSAEVGKLVEQAWRKTRSPIFRERQEKIDVMDKETDATNAAIARTMVMKELETPRETFVLMRGEYDKPDKARPVQRGVPVAMGALPKGAEGSRLGLAKWLTGPEHPLTARVAVNRMWEMVFGMGLVKTSEDFGLQGEWPSHPELLDWLAVELRESGWDQRRILRMIVTSAAYRQGSKVRPDVRERDPENRLLAAYPRRRLGAEQMRDQALYVSGLLIEKFGGPSVKTYEPEGLWAEGALPASNTQVHVTGKGKDLHRRSLYTYWKRASPPPALLALDAPTREYCVLRRTSTGTPLQALVLWNETGFVEAARGLAARTIGEEGDDRVRLGRMYRRCTGHGAEEKELAALERALGEFRKRFAGAPEDAARLLAVGESAVPEGVEKGELAAWTMVGQAMLSLYRTTMQE